MPLCNVLNLLLTKVPITIFDLAIELREVESANTSMLNDSSKNISNHEVIQDPNYGSNFAG
jgi:hypothetical protein